MATLEHGSTTIGYAVEGAGPPLLLIHGTTMNRTGWDMVRGVMPAGYEHVMIELPGSGESTLPDAPLTVATTVEQVLALMDHLGHDRFHVAGYSLGAVVALATAARAPARVESCTSLCGWATTDARMRFTFGLWRRLIATDPALFMRYAVADGFTAAAIAGLEPMLEDVITMGAGTLAPGSDAQLALDEVIDIAADLAAVTAPTLVIGGAEDRWVDVSHSHALGALVRGSRVEVLPAGHLVIQEGAAQVAELLHAHVQAHVQTGGA